MESSSSSSSSSAAAFDLDCRESFRKLSFVWKKKKLSFYLASSMEMGLAAGSFIQIFMA
jgi:hypothetical protein